MIADRPREVRWSNDGHPAGIFKFYTGLQDPNLPIYLKRCVIKDTHLKICK